MATLEDEAPPPLPSLPALTLTVEYLKSTYDTLNYVLDDQLLLVLDQLEREWITTSAHLAAVTRDVSCFCFSVAWLFSTPVPSMPLPFVPCFSSLDNQTLLQKGFPSVFVDAVKPAVLRSVEQAEVDEDLIRMDDFFNNTNVAALTFGSDDSYW